MKNISNQSDYHDLSRDPAMRIFCSLLQLTNKCLLLISSANLLQRSSINNTLLHKLFLISSLSSIHGFLYFYRFVTSIMSLILVCALIYVELFLPVAVILRIFLPFPPPTLLNIFLGHFLKKLYVPCT